ncbi:hypothetical protein L9F63_012897, partial [Diploptera punctata]
YCKKRGLKICKARLEINATIHSFDLSIEFFGRLYQIPLLRVYRKHDRSLQGFQIVSWAIPKLDILLFVCLKFVYVLWDQCPPNTI